MKATEEHFKYLDTMKEVGSVNMMEAFRYMAPHFGITEREAFDISTEWRETYTERQKNKNESKTAK